MKEKIKKYLEDNQTKIIHYTVGFTAGAIAAVVIMRNRNEAHKIVRTLTVTDPETKDVKGCWVVLKNGERIPFFQPTEK